MRFNYNRIIKFMLMSFFVTGSLVSVQALSSSPSLRIDKKERFPILDVVYTGGFDVRKRTNTLEDLGTRPRNLVDGTLASDAPLSRIVANNPSNIPSNVVDLANFHLPADGIDWAPAFSRARTALAHTGGVIRISTPGVLILAASTTFPKGKPYILLRCESPATVITNAENLTSAMFNVGGANAAGAMLLGVEGCNFTGANRTASYVFSLQNANGMTFRNLVFSNLATAINSSAGYALSLDEVTADGVTSLFHSSTSAHNFVARRVKAYGGGVTFRFDAPTDNVTIDTGDFEGIDTVLQIAGGTALRFISNYIEYQVNDPIYNTAPMYGADISTNWIAFGHSPWSMANFRGGQFKGNSLHNQTISYASTTLDIEVGDNILTGTGSVAPTPYQAPTLLNYWMQQPNYSVVGFRKGRDGLVRLRGNVINKTSALNTSVFNLPSNYRPSTIHTFATSNSSNGLSAIEITPAGEVKVVHTSGTGTYGVPYQAAFDGISFEPGT